MAFINPPPEAQNALKNPDLFEDRLNYKKASYIYPIDPIPLDMIYEKPYYGKVDIYGNAVYPSESGMVQIGGSGLNLVLDFVAAAFTDLQNYMKTVKEPHFSDLWPSYKPKSATKNFHKLYHKHFVDNIYNVFINDYVLKNYRVNRKIKTFDNLVSEFVKYSVLMSGQYPITKTGFIMSTMCPNSISGLVIDLQGAPARSAHNDAIKYDKFISKESWDLYTRIVSGFGFFVDKNVPWRIIMNLGHGNVKDNCKLSFGAKKYMNSFGTDLENNAVFEDYFYRAEQFSYEDFKSRMWNIYQMLILDPGTATWGSEYKIQNCIKALWADVGASQYKTTAVAKERQKISQDYEGEFQKNYPDSFFLPHYFRIRASESKLGLSQRKINSAIKKALELNKSFGLKRALERIEDLTKQSRIYEPDLKDPSGPHPIKYFGKSTSSGLYSYKKSDNMNLKVEKKTPQAGKVYNVS